MTASAMSTQDGGIFIRILGDELRRARKARGWTRKELQEQLSSAVSLQTIATYELGIRQCSVWRLVQLCHAMDVLAHELLARVHERTRQRDETGRLVVDLDRLVLDQQPELRPFHRWGCERLDHAKLDQAHSVSLDFSALKYLAELCDLTTGDLVSRLRKLTKAEGVA